VKKVGKIMKKNHSKSANHFANWIENIIIIAILLVIIHTLIDDLSVIFLYPYKYIVLIGIIGFIFDLLFSAEFIARSIISFKHNVFKEYFIQSRGWIDLMTSLPLLLFVSGPLIYILLNTAEGSETVALGFLSILKTAKAIRVTRILRLIRVIKLFGKIQNTESVMTNQHLGTISTISVVSLVLVLVISNFLPFLHLSDHNQYLKKKTVEVQNLFNVETIKYKKKRIKAPSEKWIISHIRRSESLKDVISLSKIKKKYSKILYKNKKYNDLIHYAYHQKIQINKNYSMRLAYHQADVLGAKISILILFAILFVILALMFIYSGIFAKTISDPIYVMQKGLVDWNYNLEVKVNNQRKDEEIMQLANSFNIKWLPLKNRIYNYRKEKQEEKSSISMNDIF